MYGSTPSSNSRKPKAIMGNHVHKAWRKERRGIREPPDLPVEILIDIFARLDPVTLVRCAATSKLLRRHMTDPAFLRLIRGRRHASGGGGFVPSLLVGFFFFHHVHEGKASRFAPLPPYSSLNLSLAPPADDDDSCRFEPLESRAGLVVLRRGTIGPRGATVVELCVGSPVTGRYVLLPPTTLRVCSHVLLPAADDDDNDDGSSVDGSSAFRLFVLGRAARTQTFSSRTGAWGPVTELPAHLHPRASCLAQESAVVIRGVAHWLHRYDDDDRSSQRYGVLSIRVGTGEATAAEVPHRCLRWRRRAVAEELLLVRTADGRLGLLVAETLGISMWTLSSEEGSTSTTASWARRVVVKRARIEQSLTNLPHCHPLGCVDTKLEWFGEASGTVLFQMNFTRMLLLNLQTGEISQFSEQSCRETRQLLDCQCQPYEMDPVPILAAMKSY